MIKILSEVHSLFTLNLKGQEDNESTEKCKEGIKNSWRTGQNGIKMRFSTMNKNNIFSGWCLLFPFS